MKAKGSRFLCVVTSSICKKKIHVLVLATLLLSLPYQPAVAGERWPFHLGPPVKVMTQNLYVGADIFYPAGAEDLNDFLTRFQYTIGVIVQTNFRERAKAIAKEVAHQRPHLIGLQEVYSIKVDLAGLDDDYLSILLEALQDEGLEYKAAGKVKNMDLDIPGLVTLTDYDVILARNDVEISPLSSKNYRTNLPPLVLPAPFPTVEVLRGFVALKAKVQGKEYVFVTTHLELRGKDFDPENPNPYIDAIQAAQAYELIQALAQETLPIILVGDLNSSPEDPVIDLTDDVEVIPPYKQLRMVGYADVWKENLFKQRNLDFTCCQVEDLSNQESLLSERIDYIFVRNNPNGSPISILGPVIADVVGEEPEDKTEPSGLWPSDHAGVVARMLIPTFK